jgi:hypothetical protein
VLRIEAKENKYDRITFSTETGFESSILSSPSQPKYQPQLYSGTLFGVALPVQIFYMRSQKAPEEYAQTTTQGKLILVYYSSKRKTPPPKQRL